MHGRLEQRLSILDVLISAVLHRNGVAQSGGTIVSLACSMCYVDTHSTCVRRIRCALCISSACLLSLV